MNTFRPLTKDEIDCRVATATDKGCSVLLYKDARVDQNLLDEAFGPFAWTRTHQVIDGRLYCTVGIRNPETGEWVYKQDVGTESKTEAEKGQASDSFKRACFNWGIGRELYSAPFIWISSADCNVTNGRNGKPTCYDKFRVASIEYDGGNIVGLTIANDSRKGAIVYTLNARKTPVKAEKATNPKNSTGKTEKPANGTINADEWKSLQAACKSVGVPVQDLLAKYQVSKASEISSAMYNDMLAYLAKS